MVKKPMIAVGIEAMNIFGGSAYIDVNELAEFRCLNTDRFQKLLVREKSVVLPNEDAVSCGINAAQPILESLSRQERKQIELLITCSESGVDFGKSISTYIHEYLGLPKRCRLFEVKQACYAGTAGFQMAASFILSQVSPGAKALIIATDISRQLDSANKSNASESQSDQNIETDSMKSSYAELSNGAGAVAMIVSENPTIFRMDVGASGYYGYEVMDTCRPIDHCELGNADLSLLSYLDCCEAAFREYRVRVSNVDYLTTFHYLAFHMPFGGMIKGAHRAMMRKLTRASAAEIETDFKERVAPGMIYGQQVGNIMSGTIFMSLASTIDHGHIPSARRIGCFSYGSGCCSEFYSGVVTPEGQERLRHCETQRQLAARYRLSMEEYKAVLEMGHAVRFGTRNVKLHDFAIPAKASYQGNKRIYLKEIKDFHRIYEWQR